MFIVGVGQEMRNYGPYKASLRGWLQDAAFWTATSQHVAWWGQEVYASCSRVCAPGARVRIAERSTATNDFTQHMVAVPRRADRLRLEPVTAGGWSPEGAYTWCAPQLPGAAFNPG